MVYLGDYPANAEKPYLGLLKPKTSVQTRLLVSTYVVCERLSVMHEPAGVVEILVQILQFTPIL